MHLCLFEMNNYATQSKNISTYMMINNFWARTGCTVWRIGSMPKNLFLKNVVNARMNK